MESSTRIPTTSVIPNREIVSSVKFIIFMMTNGLVRIGIPGYITSSLTGIILLVAVGFDVKWAKNRGKVIQKIYVNPAVLSLSPAPSIERGSKSPYAQNDRLAGAEAILLDNMSPEELRARVSLRRSGLKFEASGGVTLATVRPIAETGVDFISVGQLTHSARAIDLSLELFNA